jgi:hypothetical protein
MCPFRMKVNSAPFLLISMATGKCFTVLLEGGGYRSVKHIKYSLKAPLNKSRKNDEIKQRSVSVVIADC